MKCLVVSYLQFWNHFNLNYFLCLINYPNLCPKVYLVPMDNYLFWTNYNWTLILEKVMKKLLENSQIYQTYLCCLSNLPVFFPQFTHVLVILNYPELELWFILFPLRGRPKSWWERIWIPSFKRVRFCFFKSVQAFQLLYQLSLRGSLHQIQCLP